MKGYKNLKVWALSHELTLEIYRITQQFPKNELYALVSQMRRAAYSIPANIVEGKARRTDKEFRHFLTIARGSTDELAYFLLLSKDLNYIAESVHNPLSDKCVYIASMLNNLIKRVNGDQQSASR